MHWLQPCARPAKPAPDTSRLVAITLHRRSARSVRAGVGCSPSSERFAPALPHRDRGEPNWTFRPERSTVAPLVAGLLPVAAPAEANAGNARRAERSRRPVRPKMRCTRLFTTVFMTYLRIRMTGFVPGALTGGRSKLFPAAEWSCEAGINGTVEESVPVRNPS